MWNANCDKEQIWSIHIHTHKHLLYSWRKHDLIQDWFISNNSFCIPVWFQDVNIKINFMGQILLNTSCAQVNWNWLQLDAVSEDGTGTENHNVRRSSYKTRHDLVLWMKEETFSMWPGRKKSREKQKIWPNS